MIYKSQNPLVCGLGFTQRYFSEKEMPFNFGGKLSIVIMVDREDLARRISSGPSAVSLAISEAFAAHYLALNIPVTCCTNSRPASSTENSHFESTSSIPCLTFFMFIYEFFTPVHVELPSAQSTAGLTCRW